MELAKHMIATPFQIIRIFLSICVIIYAVIFIPPESLKSSFFTFGGFIELFSVTYEIQKRRCMNTNEEVIEVISERGRSAAMVLAGVVFILSNLRPVKAVGLNVSQVDSGIYTTQSTVTMLIVAAIAVFVISVWLALKQQQGSIMSVLLSLFSAVMLLYSGFLYSSGRLITDPFSAVNSTGEILTQYTTIQDASTSTMLYVLGVVFFIVFVLQAVDLYESMDTRDGDDEHMESF
jgi:hypothetical protein